MAGVETRHGPIILSMTTPTGRCGPRRQCLCLGRAAGERHPEDREKLRVLCVSVVENLWLRPAQRRIAPDQVSVIIKLSASVVQEHAPPNH
jgi:hypothetical protein